MDVFNGRAATGSGSWPEAMLEPDHSKPTGSIALNYCYVQTAVGWVLSLLPVAGFSGLVKSGQPAKLTPFAHDFWMLRSRG